MKYFEYLIQSNEGIHARPATIITTISKKYQSKITIANNDNTVDGKRMIAVMSLNGNKGDIIKVTIEGEDEEQAYNTLLIAFKENL